MAFSAWRSGAWGLFCLGTAAATTPACAQTRGAILDPGRPDLPALDRPSDFVRHPPALERVTATALPTGETLIEVHYAKDARLGPTIMLPTGDQPLVLRDDGKGGDRRAGDGVYALPVPLPFEELATRQEKLLEELGKERIARGIPVFSGREQVARRAYPAAAVERVVVLDPDLFWILVDPARSLFVTAPAVITDPDRTYDPCGASPTGNPDGVWSFKHLMEEMANQPLTGIDAGEMAYSALRGLHWTVPDGSPPFWPASGGHHLLTQAPFRLEAIVNRIDLAGNPSYGPTSGAEGRFIFRSCQSSRKHLIVEYHVQRFSCTSLKDWAVRWLALGNLALGNPAYNSALAKLTEEFVRRNAAPSRPNGSALGQLRANILKEITSVGETWFLDEFHLQPAPAGLVGATVAQTPSDGFNNTADLASWINLNQSDILAGRHVVTPTFVPFDPGRPFLANESTALRSRVLVGGVPQDQDVFWNAPGIVAPEARHKFALATCNGCHLAETGTDFQHIGGGTLSGFLTGIDVPDPANPSVSHHFDDLARRALALTRFASASCRFPLKEGLEAFPLPPIAHVPATEPH